MNITPEELLKESRTLEPQLQQWRRTLHRHPEVGFDLTQTKALVKTALTEMGYEPKDCGRAGVLALAGGKKPGRTILLRADMDALPISEESGEEFRSEVPGKMHGCGHDMHTAMLLGAAKLLKAHEDELEGTVKLEFQPAEEIFQGSPDMLANGLLEDPHVDAAVMFHVLAGMPLPTGTVLVPGGGITMASCEQYHIVVRGKGGHGSTPENCIDPITAAAHIHIALQEINSRELKPGDVGVLTTGRFEAGAASNVIPDVAQMWGTIRTTDPENKVGFVSTGRICYPVSEAKTDVDAARVLTFACPDDDWAFTHTMALDPVCLGRWPEPDICGPRLAASIAAVPQYINDALPLGKPDMVGLNVYNAAPAQMGENGPSYVERPAGYAHTAMNWPVEPECLNWGPRQMQERYGLPMFITENGLSCTDKVYRDGKVHDADRIDFLARYLEKLSEGIHAGADVRGYFQWSLLDNFEWHSGYRERFGLVYVDYATGQRIPKDSAFWYGEVAATNGQSI